MNYLAHAFRFLDDPIFAAGTAVPDWLSVVNRRCRARQRLVRQALDTEGSLTDETEVRFAEGVLQHHNDDDTFHRSPVFLRLESELAGVFREDMPDPFDHRPGFLGHITVELLLDAWIADRIPGVLERYYRVVADVCPRFIESTTGKFTTKEPAGLAVFVRAFLKERFLFDYSDDDRLLFRLNRVLHRVRLPEMAPHFSAAIRRCREIVFGNCADLASSAGLGVL